MFECDILSLFGLRGPNVKKNYSAKMYRHKTNMFAMYDRTYFDVRPCTSEHNTNLRPITVEQNYMFVHFLPNRAFSLWEKNVSDHDSY